jgi:NAD(P)-dependent dehydrogenase (short-subunit alcohol dehydrogenase family)
MASARRSTTLALGGGSVLVAATLLARRNERAARRDAAFFRDKHVLVTGGSRGLGFVLVGRLLAAGSRVTICGRDQHAIDSALASYARYPSAIFGVACDVRDSSACAELVHAAEQRYGTIDVLINNAGIIEVGPFDDLTDADFTSAMDTHFWAPLHTMRAVLGSMRGRRNGRIANVASVGGIVGVPHLAAYSASKFAQIGLTQAVAAEVAGSGVKITSVIPGLMLTGSPDHARFKGRHRAEYAWFTLSDANPLISTPANRAAKRILRAIRRGDAEVIIGWTAGLASRLHALAPTTTARVLALAATALPRPGGIGADSRTGAQSQSGWTQNALTALNRSAMRDANQ